MARSNKIITPYLMCCVPLLIILFFLTNSNAQPYEVSWIHLSSNFGDLPAIPQNSGQSGARIFDLDQNGQADYVITLWNAEQTVV
jgi:hypothetical protein